MDRAVLAERGIHGNAHMIMLEEDSDTIAGLLADCDGQGASTRIVLRQR